MTYKKGNNINKLRILNKDFVEKNKNKCVLLINNKKFRLKEFISISKRRYSYYNI